MATNAALQELINRTAAVLGVSVDQLRHKQPVIDEILQYFDTGETPDVSVPPDEPFPIVVRPGVLRIGDKILAVRTVSKRCHPIVRTVKEAFVTFEALTEPQFEALTEPEVPLWREVPLGEVRTHGSMAFTFRSAMTAQDNLRAFALAAASPPPGDDELSAARQIEQWMAQKSQRS